MKYELKQPIRYPTLTVPQNPDPWPNVAQVKTVAVRPTLSRAPSTQVLDPFVALEPPSPERGVRRAVPAFPKRIPLRIQLVPPAIEDVSTTLATADVLLTAWLRDGRRPAALLQLFDDLSASARVFANPMMEHEQPVPWVALAQIGERYLNITHQVVHHRSALDHTGLLSPVHSGDTADSDAVITAACHWVTQESDALADSLEATRFGLRCVTDLVEAYHESRLGPLLKNFYKHDTDDLPRCSEEDPKQVGRVLERTARTVRRLDSAYSDVQRDLQARLKVVHAATPTRITPYAVPHALQPGHTVMPQTARQLHRVALAYSSIALQYQTILSDLDETRHMFSEIIKKTRDVVRTLQR